MWNRISEFFHGHPHTRGAREMLRSAVSDAATASHGAMAASRQLLTSVAEFKDTAEAVSSVVDARSSETNRRVRKRATDSRLKTAQGVLNLIERQP